MKLSLSHKADCGKPVIPRAIAQYPYGKESTLEGSSVQFICDIGSVMDEGGDDKIVCKEDGNWTPINFYCRRKYDLFQILWNVY